MEKKNVLNYLFFMEPFSVFFFYYINVIYTKKKVNNIEESVIRKIMANTRKELSEEKSRAAAKNEKKISAFNVQITHTHSLTYFLISFFFLLYCFSSVFLSLTVLIQFDTK